MGRRACLLAALSTVLLAAAPAHADRMYAPPPAPPPPRDDFWRDVVSPNADEIAQVMLKVDAAVQLALQAAAINADYQDAAGQRARLLDEAIGMLRYARRLDPANPDVLRRLGEVAEEAGRALVAIDALQAYLAELDPDQPAPLDAHARLGRAFLRVERWDDAIRHLRAALPAEGASQGYYNPGYGYGYAQGVIPSPAAAAYLGLALMETGRLADAIDVLRRHATPPMYGGLGPEQAQTMFILAVAYDRDEQISAAFTVLDGLATAITGGGGGYNPYGAYAPYLYQHLWPMTFAPAHDRHYVNALLYESAGYLAEARTSWLLYAQVDDAPYRARALAHVAAIDTLLEERLRAAAKAAKAPKPPATTPPPAAPPRRPPHRHPPRRP